MIWPTFLKNVSADPRSWQAGGGPTAFFTVHLVLTVVSLGLGSAIGVIGVRGLLAARKAARERASADSAPLRTGAER